MGAPSTTTFEVDLLRAAQEGDDGDRTTSGESAKVRGTLTIDLDYEFVLDLQDSTVEAISFALEGDQDLDLNLEGITSAARQIREESTFFQQRLPVMTFFIGIVPVVTVPGIEIQAGVDSAVSGTYSVGALQSFDATMGASYTAADGWEPIGEADFSLEPKEPNLRVEATMEGYLKPQLETLVYGVAGPVVDLKPYI